MSFKKLNSGDFSLSVAPIVTQITSIGTDVKDFNSSADEDDEARQIYQSLSNII